jgi:hypothetical protein
LNTVRISQRLLASLPLITFLSLGLLASAHIFDQHHLLKDSSLYANTHQLEKRQDETTCRNGPCSFLDSLGSTCFTQDCICSALYAASNETVQACETCIRPFDSLLADSLVALSDQCAFLNFSANATYPTTISYPTAAPTFPANCDGPCGAITSAFSTCTGTDYSCWCSPVFASGVACEQCLATVNAGAGAELVISIDIPSCFNLVNTQPINTATINTCFDTQGPCYPLIQATMLEPGATTRCVGGPCVCPGALAAGTSCIQCVAMLNPSLASEFADIGEIITSCQVSTGYTTTPYATYGGGSSSAGRTSTAANASPTILFQSAAGRSDVHGDILFKGVIYFGLFLLIFVLVV